MVIKLLFSIAAIIIIAVSLFSILKVNTEEDKIIFNNETQKFIGKWKLIETGEISLIDQTPDTTGEINNYLFNETYDFLFNGIYYHLVDEDNSSGKWEINNSILKLKVNDSLTILPLNYKYSFSDDYNRLILTPLEDSGNFIGLEKAII